ncbi:MAG: hypothetical protein KBT49_07540 [Bacteroidetes bacterium]|nr:hypothetical protein [Candidatus Colenecus caballi]
MRTRVISFVLTSLLMSLCIPMCAQQPQDSVDALPPGFNRAFYDEKASAEEVIRRNPSAWKINDNGILEVNGKEVHQMLVNGKVVYSYKDTITDPARLLEEITRRVNANNHPVEPVIAHIVDNEFLPDSVLTPYRLPEGVSVEDLIRKLPGVEVLDDGSVTVNGKFVTRIQVEDSKIIEVDSDTRAVK